MSRFQIYKAGQGKYTRTITFVAVMVIGCVAAYLLSLQFSGLNVFVQYGVPVALVGGLGALMFWIVNRPRSADFLIATESEMKKVSWSSRKEVVGSTKVVIVTTLLLAVVLYGIDAMFVVLFRLIGIGIGGK